MVAEISRCSRRISVRISTRSRASRADRGSSIRSTFGSLMMARPMATRCCWPPESCPGFWPSLSPRPRVAATRSTFSSTRARGRPAIAQRVADVLAHGHVREQRDVLEHHGDVALLRGQRRHVGVAEPDAARGRRLESGDHPERGRLAAAGRAHEGEELALADLQREIAHGVDGAGAAAESLLEMLQPDGEGHPYPVARRARSGGSAAGRTRAGTWAPRRARRRPSPCPSARRSARRSWRGRRAA